MIWVVLSCEGVPTPPSPVQADVPAQPEVATGTGAAPGFTSSQCGEEVPGGELRDDWWTASLSCGETVVGNTTGGASVFDGRFYEHHFCAPPSDNYAGGGERAYRFEMPAGRYEAEIHMDTPCGDLDLLAWPWAEDCAPTRDDRISRCEASHAVGKRSDEIHLTQLERTSWVVVVEGKQPERLPFALTIMCREW